MAGRTRGTDRGRADPVSVEGEADPPAGTEYLPDDHAVRYVAYLRPDDEEPPESDSAYETRPFEDWARTECASLGKERVAEAVESRLGADRGIGYAVGQYDGDGADGDSGDDDREDGDNRNGDGGDSDSPDIAVYVEICTMRGRDGEVVSGPPVEYETLCDAAPESVTATVRFAGLEHTETLPVAVGESEGQFL